MSTFTDDSYILAETAKMRKQLNETKGTNEKIRIMASYPHLKPLIRRIWDEQTTSGVTKAGLEKYAATKLDKSRLTDMTLYDLLDALCKRTLSGDTARATIYAFAAKHPEHRDLVLDIMCKELRLRMGAKVIGQAFPGIYEAFPVMLASEYDEVKFKARLLEHSAHTPACYFSDKIDGMRLVVIVRAGKSQIFSRAANELTTMAVLRAEIDSMELKEDCVLDAEVVALDPDGKENFKLTVSEARKKDVVMVNPRMKLFDIIPYAEWLTGAGTQLFAPRLLAMQALPAREHIIVLPQTPYTPETFTAAVAEAKEAKKEGLMLRFNHHWEGKRSKYLMKYKFIETEEFKIVEVGVEDMKFPNKTGGETVVKAVKNVKILYKGDPVWVGSGFTAEERKEWGKTPDKLIGKLIVVKFQEPFQDAETKRWSLRCPTLQTVLGDYRDI